MKFVEKTLVGKKSQETCEDAIVVTSNFVAVIDGSTSKTPFQLVEGMSNGKAAALLLRSILTDYPNLTPNLVANVQDFCHEVTEFMQDWYKLFYPLTDFSHHPEKRLCASMVIYNKKLREIWMIGDCQAMVNGVIYENPKPYEAQIAQKRADLIKGGMSPADARKAIEPLLIEAMHEGQNQTYAVLDGFPVYMPGVKVIPVPAIDTAKGTKSEIILASDGYPFLKPTLAESEDALRKQLEQDPQNIDNFFATKGLVQGNKSFDDRAYMRFICPKPHYIKTK